MDKSISHVIIKAFVVGRNGKQVEVELMLIPNHVSTHDGKISGEIYLDEQDVSFSIDADSLCKE